LQGSVARTEGDVLVVSGLEKLLYPRVRGAAHILEELTHVPRLIAISRPMGTPQLEVLADMGIGMFPLKCPGLCLEDARALARETCGNTDFADDTFEFLARRASVEGRVNPGRLLYLLRLLDSRDERAGRKTVYRDEVGLPSRAAGTIWSEDQKQGHA
jgi:hypothetical protein